MDLIKIDEALWKVMENPQDYDIEICSTAFGVLKGLNRIIYDMQKNVENRIIHEMVKDEATKLNYMNVAGEYKVITLKDGPMRMAVTNAEEMIKNEGFDPNQMGTYEYKLFPWSKLKEMRKLGGAIKDLIDKLYIRGKKTLVIGDK